MAYPYNYSEKSLTRYVMKKENCVITLDNNQIIDHCYERLALLVFSNYSGETFTGKPEIQPHYAGGGISRDEWVKFQCNRLNIPTLKGELKLVNTFTGEKLAHCCVL